jgi:hypothetical protein
VLAGAGVMAFGVFLYLRGQRQAGRGYGERIQGLLFRLGPDAETRLRRLDLVVRFFEVFRDEGDRELEDCIARRRNRQAWPRLPEGTSETRFTLPDR